MGPAMSADGVFLLSSDIVTLSMKSDITGDLSSTGAYTSMDIFGDISLPTFIWPADTTIVAPSFLHLSQVDPQYFFDSLVSSSDTRVLHLV